MPTSYTSLPSEAVPGEIVGNPIAHLPYILVCTQGERHCGWARAANTPKHLVERMAEKRRHEDNCQGGLIVASGR